MSEFEFRCTCCGDIHKGIPTFGAEFPVTVLQVAEDQRESRVDLGTDDCVIDGKEFYVKGCIEIPVTGFSEPFIWATWVSLSEESYHKFVDSFDLDSRSHIGPFTGWHYCDFAVYEIECINLETRVHLRDNGIRPLIELMPSDHPLALEQKKGITRDRLIQIYEKMMHG
ncbi:MAG: DUF2199 domain-containing protein [Granulosicoccus sp.]